MEVDKPTAMVAPHLDDAVLIETKRLARSEAARRRAALDPALGEALAERALAGLVFPTGALVAGVWPLPGELDLRPLLNALHARGHALALPETTPRGQTLIFRRWAPGEALLTGRFNTMHPAGAAVSPDVIMVPLLAFDRRGNRLGYGGGYYDRSLAALPTARAYGFGYAAQEVASVPAGPLDRALDAIVTECEVIDCASRSDPRAA